MLLTSGARLSPGVAAEVAGLGASRVVVLGGTAAIGTTVIEELAASDRSVERIAGADGYATAVAVSEVAGLTTIAPDGTMAPVDSVRLETLGGTSPAHLGVRSGSDDVTMMLVETDGVHVYHRVP